MDRRLEALCRRSRALDFDRALAENGRERADGGEDRGDDGADDSDGERKLGHGPAVLFDDNATDIALVKQVLHGIDELSRRDLERFRERRLIHTSSYVGVEAPVHFHGRVGVGSGGICAAGSRGSISSRIASS